ncbi:PTS cellobiose transporter subunit IIC [Brachyspira pilosicoli]|uniref:PTS cellobiose transporter subunit IIC n=1 Tax=Brachyspira pilosicoli TaxID=52584 RepID=UPI0030048CD4
MKLDKLNYFLETKFIPIANKIGGNKYLQSVRDGLLMSMPFIMIGSIFLILTNLPIPGYSNVMENIFGEKWKMYFSIPSRGTFDILALFASISIAYNLAKRYEIDSLSTAITSFACFIISTPLSIFKDDVLVSDKALVFDFTSSKGLFVAIVVSILVTEICNFFIKRNWVIKMPDSVPAAAARSFNALIPSGAAIIIIWAIRYILSVTPFDNLHNIINFVLGKPISLLGQSLIGILIGLIIQQLLWSVGLHGSSILLAVLRPPFMMLLDQNRMAFEAGQPLPNIINLSFYELWIQFGGSGTTLGLVFSLLLFVKSKQLKNLGKLAIIPSLFNINEPVSFGIPIIMNPIMFIPWIVAPLVSATVTYFAMSFGLVAKATGVLIPWTTPCFISGTLATNSISGGILQIILIVITGAIYYPFIRAWDKQKLMEEQAKM